MRVSRSLDSSYETQSDISSSSETTSSNSSYNIQNLNRIETNPAFDAPPVIVYMHHQYILPQEADLYFAKWYLYHHQISNINTCITKALQAYIVAKEADESQEIATCEQDFKVRYTMCLAGCGITSQSLLETVGSIPIALGLATMAIAHRVIGCACCCICIGGCEGEIVRRSDAGLEGTIDAVACGVFSAIRCATTCAALPWVSCCPLWNAKEYMHFTKYMDEKVANKIQNIKRAWELGNCNYPFCPWNEEIECCSIINYCRNC